MKGRVRGFFTKLQDEICTGLEGLEGGARFQEDRWKYRPGEGPGQGGGATRVISDGEVFERGGVNYSEVTGELSPRLAARLKVEPRPFFATGVSLVLHPVNPMVPTAHMNVRYLELPRHDNEPEQAWFGGGADLTPYYLFEEDAVHFHRCWKSICDAHDPECYPRFKRWCDEYFFLKHRGEARGVGGIFFDYLRDDPEGVFRFVQRIGGGFLEAYLPIVRRRLEDPWSEQEKRWQLIRRGRYVEFNLVYDRGTLFGLETRGRAESILVSMPPSVSWVYDHRPDAGSREEALLEVLRQPREWI